MSFTHRASHRQPGQGLVEFSLSIAAVAFVAMIGFKALSTAQGAYWGAVAPSLAAPTPGPGVFLHPTQTDITYNAATCNQGAQAFSGQTLSCTATVTDVFSSDRVPPRGSLRWTLNGTPTTCALNAVSFIASACTFNHT